MTHPPLSDIAPCQGFPLEATVSPETAENVLLLCAEILAFALHVYGHTAATEESASALRYLRAAEMTIHAAQQAHRRARQG